MSCDFTPDLGDPSPPREGLGFLFEVSEMYGDNSIGSADGATYSSDAATFNSNETNEVFEGTRAISITWSGMGVALIITSPQNLSNYTHFGFSFNSPDPTGGG